MKAIGMPPSDPRVSQMNDAQWLWSYFNIEQDEIEEEEAWKARLDYLSWYINPEMAKSVYEHEKRNKKKDSRPIGGNHVRAEDDIYQNKAFEIEQKAALLGYTPDMDITPMEFLQQYNEKQEQKKEVDIMNDSFEDLLASGMFQEVPDTSNGAGDPTETFDEFFARVSHFKGVADEEWDMIEKMKNVPIGVESVDDLEIFENKVSSPDKEISNDEITQAEKEAIKKYLEENGLTEDDLDIFDVNE